MANPVQQFVPVRIVKSGEWLFEGDLDLPVDIVVLDYDWYYENDN